MVRREQGAGSREQGAGSREQGAGSREQKYRATGLALQVNRATGHARPARPVAPRPGLSPHAGRGRRRWPAGRGGRGGRKPRQACG
ncbi:hypothetical protein FDP22_20335 (plasmid) [Paroceanicella profunda]|uniref:Uncharacterized protein n=1 Tax=Paroceanicella profunda TaxID=2579971 RepID=A0A5B8G2A3_9RHOB|nr:hypothetical protein FDP22_20335 [Paroceanicella profunda]